MNRKKIGVDIGGTHIRVGLVKNNKIIKLLKEHTPKRKNEIKELLVSLIKKVNSSDVEAIGVGSPGPILKGKIINTPNLPLKNFNIKYFLFKKFNKKISVDNDANCVALAETKLGTKMKNIIILTLGTGIGGGIVIDGRLYNRGGLAGELGQMYLTPNKTFEELAGSKVVAKITKKYLGKTIFMSELIHINSSKSKALVKQIIPYYGQAIGNLINIFSPDIIILSGSFKDQQNKFLNLIKKETKKYIFSNQNYPIQWCKLKEPGVLGASLLIE
jgi:glucokinase